MLPSVLESGASSQVGVVIVQAGESIETGLRGSSAVSSRREGGTERKKDPLEGWRFVVGRSLIGVVEADVEEAAARKLIEKLRRGDNTVESQKGELMAGKKAREGGGTHFLIIC
jgi:hypothetical protein